MNSNCNIITEILFGIRYTTSYCKSNIITVTKLLVISYCPTLISTSRSDIRTEMVVVVKGRHPKCVFFWHLQEQSWDILLQKLCKVEFLVLTWCWRSEGVVESSNHIVGKPRTGNNCTEGCRNKKQRIFLSQYLQSIGYPVFFDVHWPTDWAERLILYKSSSNTVYCKLAWTVCLSISLTSH